MHNLGVHILVLVCTWPVMITINWNYSTKPHSRTQSNAHLGMYQAIYYSA